MGGTNATFARAEMRRATVAIASMPRSSLACQVDKGEAATCEGWDFVSKAVYMCGSGGASYSCTDVWGKRQKGREGCGSVPRR